MMKSCGLVWRYTTTRAFNQATHKLFSTVLHTNLFQEGSSHFLDHLTFQLVLDRYTHRTNSSYLVFEWYMAVCVLQCLALSGPSRSPPGWAWLALPWPVSCREPVSNISAKPCRFSLSFCNLLLAPSWLFKWPVRERHTDNFLFLKISHCSLFIVVSCDIFVVWSYVFIN